MLKTILVAVVSSATTAVLFSACAVQGPSRTADPGQPPTAAAPATAGATAAGPVTTGASAPGSVPVVRASAAAQQIGINPAVAVYQQAGPSVVNITSLAVVRRSATQLQIPQGVGSGVIIDADGRIITNNHVVQDAAQLSVTFQDRTTVPAELIGRDQENDLAVIKVDPNATDSDGRSIRDRLRPAQLGDSDQVTVGETAVAIGSPLGLQQTVTSGIVSARRNPGEESASRGQSIELLGGAIQTDAAINPGNSGGPLFNANAQVIGINTAILSQSGGNEGVGFAIPINVAKRVSAELIQTGRYRHPQVGVTSIALSELSPQVRDQLGIPSETKGLLVQQVTAGAQQAGIQAGARRVSIGAETILTGGDIIVAIDGQPVTSGGDLRGWIENNRHPGDTVTLTVIRDGQRQDVPVVLTERPAQQTP